MSYQHKIIGGDIFIGAPCMLIRLGTKVDGSGQPQFSMQTRTSVSVEERARLSQFYSSLVLRGL